MSHCQGRIAGPSRNLLSGFCLQHDCILRGPCSPRLLDAHETIGIGFWCLAYWSLQYAIPLYPEDLPIISENQGGFIESGNIDIRRLVNGMGMYLNQFPSTLFSKILIQP